MWLSRMPEMEHDLDSDRMSSESIDMIISTRNVSDGSLLSDNFLTWNRYSIVYLSDRDRRSSPLQRGFFVHPEWKSKKRVKYIWLKRWKWYNQFMALILPQEHHQIQYEFRIQEKYETDEKFLHLIRLWDSMQIRTWKIPQFWKYFDTDFINNVVQDIRNEWNRQDAEYITQSLLRYLSISSKRDQFLSNKFPNPEKDSKFAITAWYLTQMILSIPKIPEEVMMAIEISQKAQDRQKQIFEMTIQTKTEVNEFYLKYWTLVQKMSAYLKSFL
jgi:hypothetical protein